MKVIVMTAMIIRVRIIIKVRLAEPLVRQSFMFCVHFLKMISRLLPGRYLKIGGTIGFRDKGDRGLP